MAAQLTKGQVDRLTHDDVVVSVRHSEPVDVSALLLDSAGKVRDETDLVFYNQTAAHGVRLASDRPELSIGLRSLPPEIEHVRIVVSLADPEARFGDHEPALLAVSDRAGNPVYEYSVEGLGEESAVIVADLDRVGSSWQLRPLGHGFPAGFAALVTAHGVPVGQASEQLPYRGPAVLDPGQEVALNHIRDGELSMVRMGVGWDPMKVHGPRGLRPLEVDLDASALLFVGKTLVDTAYYQQLSSRDGAVRHSGDNLTGDGKGDDEVITVDLARLPAQVSAVVFVVTSYAGHTFERIRNGYWRLVDGSTTAELARGNLRGGGAHTGMVVAKVYRDGSVWRAASIATPIQAGHPVEAVPLVMPSL
ncbi:TerD domain-containing protein [Nocardia nova SH22a]|uniref:TerD domain-containing protein n=1 Tax=Nocardia nova SH22a TaxID=1415166 RepID=W5THM1_9NOCA|nr:TerD family protein [Nocardia nova]AHH18845.1 TerD domain-containing protein [Nocardia nova SH22a]